MYMLLLLLIDTFDFRWPWPAVVTSRISAPWPKPEVRQKQWERWILATRPPGTVASDKILAHQLCRIKFLQRESRETSKVFIRRKKEYMWIHTHTHTHTRGLREWVTPSWLLESLLRGISSRFHLANHLALLGSESEVSISQGAPMCACIS